MATHDPASLLYPLHEATRHIHRTFELWAGLFTRGPEQGALLERIAPAFFGLLDSILPDEVMLSLARLLDDSKTGRFENYSIEYLIKELPPTVSTTARTKIVDLHANLRKNCATLMEHRNKRLAHADRAWTVSPQAAGYQSPTVQEVRDAVSVMKTLTELITSAMHGCDYHLGGIFQAGGAGGIIRALEESAMWRDLRAQAADLGSEQVMRILGRGERWP